MEETEGEVEGDTKGENENEGASGLGCSATPGSDGGSEWVRLRLPLVLGALRCGCGCGCGKLKKRPGRVPWADQPMGGARPLGRVGR